MTKQLPQEIIEIAERGQYSNEYLGMFVRAYLSLPQEQEECTACYGKGKYSIYKGDEVAGVDFPGDKPFLVAKGGVKEFPCPKCKGKIEQEDTKQIEKINGLHNLVEKEEKTAREKIQSARNKAIEIRHKMFPHRA